MSGTIHPTDERRERMGSPRRNYYDRAHPQSSVVRSYPYRSNWRRQSQRGWSTFGYDRSYAQPDRRSYSFRDDTQAYYIRKSESIPRLCDLQCQPPRRRDTDRKEPERNNDEPKQSETLDLTSLNLDLLSKIQELLKTQK